jgi:CheY-like chemotaxis protein
VECKVVVADDEKIIVSAIAYALVREGFQVETAADGEEALRKVSKDAYCSSYHGRPMDSGSLFRFSACPKYLQRFIN